MRFPATIIIQFLVKTESKKLLFVKYNNMSDFKCVSRSGSIRRLQPSDFATVIKIFRQTTLGGPVGGGRPPCSPLATPLVEISSSPPLSMLIDGFRAR